MTSDDTRLRERTASLTSAVDLAGSRLSEDVATRVREAIDGVHQRLALGVDHTVVALAGGTGSGKSSLFNQLTRLDFADVGVKRPTTARVTACAWSASAAALLDWLDVDVERRISRDLELDAEDESALAGLVLLDLPDHDSIEPAHRAVVDRILPLVDVLVWVVDPQKYADDALHSGYLSKSAGQEGSTVVALNQADTVPSGRRAALLADLRRLLTEDGLEGAPLVTVSARTGEGLRDLWSLLEAAVARRSIAAGRVAGELDRASRLILEDSPESAMTTVAEVAADESAAIAEAVGLTAVAEQVANGVRNGYGHPEFDRVQQDAVGLARTRWTARTSRGLRPGWARALESALAPSARIAAAIRKALSDVDLSTQGPPSGPTMRKAAFWAFGVAAMAAVLAVLGLAGVLSWSATAAVCGGLAGVALLVGLAIVFVRGRLRESLARRREKAVIEAGEAAIKQVVQETMAVPTQELLDAHRKVRELAVGAAEPSTGTVEAPSSTVADKDEAAK